MARRSERLRIGTRRIGEADPCFVIAEAGVNHNGRLDLALGLIDAAVDAGADAVKFQAFDPDLLVTADASRAPYQSRAGQSSQLDMLRELVLSPADLLAIARHARARAITLLITPFDERSLAAVRRLGIPAVKLGSGEVTNSLLLRAAARTRLPVLLSTGLSTFTEIDGAVKTCRTAGCRRLMLFHCVSAYPSPIDEMNVRAIQTMRERYRVPVGLSDHSQGTAAAAAAVALGAAAIEKHLTTDKRLPGPDHAASLDPQEFSGLVAMIRDVQRSLGDGVKRCMPAERQNVAHVRRSCVAAAAISRGTTITAADLVMKRPATGIPASSVDDVIGCRTRRDIQADQILTWNLLKR